MSADRLSEQIRTGLFEAKRGNTRDALFALEGHAEKIENPEVLAWYGYCLASERKSYRNGLDWCLKALQIDPKCSSAYLSMGKIYLQADRKKSALKAFSKGLTFGQDPSLLSELRKHGTRKPPVFPFALRGNRLNIYSGRLLGKLHLR